MASSSPSFYSEPAPALHPSFLGASTNYEAKPTQSSSVTHHGPVPPAASLIENPGSSLPGQNQARTLVNLGAPVASSIIPTNSGLVATSVPITDTEKRNDDALHLIFQELKRLSDNVAELNKKIDGLHKRSRQQDVTFEPPTGFPIKELKEFDDFENDEERASILQRHLEFVGGHNLRDALNKFIRASISNNLADKFTWTGKSTGQSSKRAFYRTNLAKIFYRAAKNIPQIGKFTRSEFVGNFQEILRSYKQTARNARSGLHLQQKRNRRMEEEEDLFPDEEDEFENP